MSRYKCHICEVEHGTENMVAYCAACFDKLRAELAVEKKSALDAMKACRIWQKEAEALRGDIEATERSAQWHCNDAIKLANQVRALEDALAQIANIMGGPTMTYSPENEVSEWRGRWQSCAGIVARALSSPAAEAKEKPCLDPETHVCDIACPPECQIREEE